MTRKRWILLGCLFLLAALLVVVVYFYRYEHNFTLLLEKCQVDTSEDVLQVIDQRTVDGRESMVLMTRVLPGSQLGAEDSYSVFLQCVKNSRGFWALEGYSCINTPDFNHFQWQYPLGNGQNEYHVVYCGINTQNDASFRQFQSRLPENVTVRISLDDGTYLIHLRYTAERWTELDFLDMLEESGITPHQAWADMIPKDLLIEAPSKLSELELEAVVQKLVSYRTQASEDPAYEAWCSAIDRELYRLGQCRFHFDPRTYTAKNTLPNGLVFGFAVTLIPLTIVLLLAGRKKEKHSNS